MKPGKRSPSFRVGDEVVCARLGKLGTIEGRWQSWFCCQNCNEPFEDVAFIPTSLRTDQVARLIPKKCPECGKKELPKLNNGSGIYYVRFGNVVLSLHGRLLKLPKPSLFRVTIRLIDDEADTATPCLQPSA